MKKMIKASIVIPSYNRKEILKEVLTALFNQSYPQDKYEIVLVDDGSTDGTEQMISSLFSPCKVKYLRNKQRMGAPKTRNRGVKKAEGEFIIFVDSDVIVLSDFIEQHLNYHKKYGDVIVNGELIQISSLDEVGKKRKGVFDISFSPFDTANVSIRKKFLLEVGLFDESFSVYGWQDIELGYRLIKRGLKRKKNRSALGYHYKKKGYFNLNYLCEKEKRRGISGALYYKKYPEFKVKLATQCNPLFAFAFIGKWVDEKESGKKLLEFAQKHKIGWLCDSLVRLTTCHYYLQGFREEIKKTGK
ncbi:MAG: glycosyltransferase [Candidatus Aerophobetes bacterium]|nr:glycosyltransferase [Candidatus Aerophobetes bacterium]